MLPLTGTDALLFIAAALGLISRASFYCARSAGARSEAPVAGRRRRPHRTTVLALRGPHAWAPGAALALLLLVKAAVSLPNTPRRAAHTGALSVALVMPFYEKEDDWLRRTLRSIVAQFRRPDHLFIVNDGSLTGHEAICRLAAGDESRDSARHVCRVRLVQGKRCALATAIRAWGCDVVVTTDSDTVLAPDAIEELTKPFGRARRRVTAVTGRVAVSNSLWVL